MSTGYEILYKKSVAVLNALDSPGGKTLLEFLDDLENLYNREMRRSTDMNVILRLQGKLELLETLQRIREELLKAKR